MRVKTTLLLTEEFPLVSYFCTAFCYWCFPNIIWNTVNCIAFPFRDIVITSNAKWSFRSSQNDHCASMMKLRKPSEQKFDGKFAKNHCLVSFLFMNCFLIKSEIKKNRKEMIRQNKDESVGPTFLSPLTITEKWRFLRTIVTRYSCYTLLQLYIPPL